MDQPDPAQTVQEGAAQHDESLRAVYAALRENVTEEDKAELERRAKEPGRPLGEVLEGLSRLKRTLARAEAELKVADEEIQRFAEEILNLREEDCFTFEQLLADLEEIEGSQAELEPDQPILVERRKA